MKAPAYAWQFTPRFRRNAFGWRSDTPIQRIKEALSEIKRVARTQPIVAAEGAVIFLEKVSPALERVDSSSGAIGNAVNRAIQALVPIIAQAKAPQATRKAWLDRLWAALEDDPIPYIENLGDHWGELCATPDLASEWADTLKPICERVWASRGQGEWSYFKGSIACLSTLYSAGRHEELLHLLDQAPYKMWHYRKWGVKALIALGQAAEALRYAEDSDALNTPDSAIAEACEAILLAAGRSEEAYQHYALSANHASTHLARFRAIDKKYPSIGRERILRDLIDSTPGEEGKWFAAAKDAGFFDLATTLVRTSPADPRTLIRAAIDFAEQRPIFALEVAIAAMHWLGEGYGYEITGLEVSQAHEALVKAATLAGQSPDQIAALMQTLLDESKLNARFMRTVLGYRSRPSR